jgi:hypothetical protein
MRVLFIGGSSQAIHELVINGGFTNVIHVVRTRTCAPARHGYAGRLAVRCA